MGRSAHEFWDRVHERWRAEDPEREEETVRSILTHLRRRLRGPEVRHLEDELPADVKALWLEPEVEDHRRGQRPIEKWSFDQLLGMVTDEAGLVDRSEAARATAAVIHGLSPLISDTEEKHLTDQLPKELQEMWREELGIPKHPAPRKWGRHDHAPRRIWGGGTPRRKE